MKAEQTAFLGLDRHPGVLDPEQTSWKTGFREDELPIITEILKPLGHPLAANEKRLYACIAVERFISDESELNRARVAIMRHWRRKNASRRDKPLQIPQQHEINSPTAPLVGNGINSKMTKMKSNGR
jgi:hypothetical protein